MNCISGDVLIVEDCKNWRKLLKLLIEYQKCNITESENKKEALCELEKKEFGLIVLDIRLNDKELFNVEGLELLEWINRNTKSKVILLTGYLHKGKMRIEADAFMPKEGFDPREFRKKTEELLIEFSL